VDSTVASVAAVENALKDLVDTFGLQDTIPWCVLSQIDVQAEVGERYPGKVATMFQSLAVGWADLVLPGTSYLERDGTYMNLEGRLQRLRRAVIPPCPDELAWIAKLAERFEGVFCRTLFQEGIGQVAARL